MGLVSSCDLALKLLKEVSMKDLHLEMLEKSFCFCFSYYIEAMQHNGFNFSTLESLDLQLNTQSFYAMAFNQEKFCHQKGIWKVKECYRHLVGRR